MAAERLPARFSLRSQFWFRWTGKCFEAATSHMPDRCGQFQKPSEKLPISVKGNQRKLPELDNDNPRFFPSGWGSCLRLESKVDEFWFFWLGAGQKKKLPPEY